MNINAIDLSSNIGQDVIAKRAESKLESFKGYFDKAQSDTESEDIKKACVEFEAYFIKQMFSAMRKTVDSSNSLIPKSNAENIFEDMLDEEISGLAAKSGGIGLADMMIKQITSTGK